MDQNYFLLDSENPFAIENEDWTGFNIMLNGNETQDFALSTAFADFRCPCGAMIRKHDNFILKDGLKLCCKCGLPERRLKPFKKDIC